MKEAQAKWFSSQFLGTFLREGQTDCDMTDQTSFQQGWKSRRTFSTNSLFGRSSMSPPKIRPSHKPEIARLDKNSGSYVELIRQIIRPASSSVDQVKQIKSIEFQEFQKQELSKKAFEIIRRDSEYIGATHSDLYYREVTPGKYPEVSPMNHQEADLLRKSLLENEAASCFIKDEERARVRLRLAQYSNRQRGLAKDIFHKAVQLTRGKMTAEQFLCFQQQRNLQLLKKMYRKKKRSRKTKNFAEFSHQDQKFQENAKFKFESDIKMVSEFSDLRGVEPGQAIQQEPIQEIKLAGLKGAIMSRLGSIQTYKSLFSADRSPVLTEWGTSGIKPQRRNKQKADTGAKSLFKAKKKPSQLNPSINIFDTQGQKQKKFNFALKMANIHREVPKTPRLVTQVSQDALNASFRQARPSSTRSNRSSSWQAKIPASPTASYIGLNPGTKGLFYSRSPRVNQSFFAEEIGSDEEGVRRTYMHGTDEQLEHDPHFRRILQILRSNDIIDGLRLLGGFSDYIKEARVQ